MRPITITYEDLASHAKEEQVNSFEDLRARVVSIGEAFAPRVAMPFGIDLVDESGSRLSVAFGATHAFLSRYSAADDESKTAVGDKNVTGETLAYFGDHTLLPNKFLVPMETVWRVIRDWCEQGVPSTLVPWTSDITRSYGREGRM